MLRCQYDTAEGYKIMMYQPCVIKTVCRHCVNVVRTLYERYSSSIDTAAMVSSYGCPYW
eukprot:m.1490962 g.1490962  ORF g.1490962 m.1490962 type:complete len:59 (-) comp25191_c0_seq34:2289-2465(-)